MPMNIKGSRIIVTGATGFLGKHLVRRLEEEGPEEIVTFSSKDYNLTSDDECKKLFNDNRNIDIVIHMASDTGGIKYNMSFPAKVFYNVSMMNSLMIHHSWKNGVKKFVGIGSVCEYPKFPRIPFIEEDLWNGYPEESNGAYGIAKRAMLAQSQAYRQQYGFNAIHLLMANMYGPGDNFDIDSGHAITAMIRKMTEAREKKEDVTLWGDGSSSREFLYVQDAAEAIVLASKFYDSPEPVNVGSGTEIKIKDLAGLIKKMTDFSGQIVWDTSKPNGQQRRLLDVSKAEKSFRFKAMTKLEDGLKSTVEYYMKTRGI